MEALEGLRILERRMEVLSNDMANVDTVGFKKQRVTFEEYLLSQPRDPARAAKGEVVKTDFSQGTIHKTGNPLDLAIEGEGFFVVQTPAGKRYTRAGNFTLDARHQLVTQQGYPVLGGGAPIVLEDTTGKGIWLSIDGRFYVDETDAGQIDVVTFEDPGRLEKAGANLYVPTDYSGPEMPVQSSVRQGYLEDSNVNPVEAMVGLIDLYRAYEAEQKAVQIMDQLDGRAANDVGKTG